MFVSGKRMMVQVTSPADREQVWIAPGLTLTFPCTQEIPTGGLGGRELTKCRRNGG